MQSAKDLCIVLENYLNRVSDFGANQRSKDAQIFLILSSALPLFKGTIRIFVIHSLQVPSLWPGTLVFEAPLGCRRSRHVRPPRGVVPVHVIGRDKIEPHLACIALMCLQATRQATKKSCYRD